MAFVAQEAFIQNKTVRENILFGRPFDPDRYTATIRGCALESDFQLLPHGDGTEIGERGINLSGGQRQRVSLARAAYSPAHVVLLDDPLSAVDAHVGKHLFEECIGGGLMEGRTRLFVTNQVQFLSAVDRVVMLEGGVVKAVGSYDELNRSNGAFRQMVDAIGQERKQPGGEDKGASGEFEETKKGSLSIKDIASTTASTAASTVSPSAVVDTSRAADGKEAATQAKGVEGGATEISQGSGQGDEGSGVRGNARGAGNITQQEKRLVGVSSMRVYKKYWLAGAGNWCSVLLLLFAYILAEASFITVDTWLSLWAGRAYGEDFPYMAVYGGLTLNYILMQVSFD